MKESDKDTEIRALKAALEKEQKKSAKLKEQHNSDKATIKNLKRRKDPKEKSKKNRDNNHNREAETVAIERISRYRYTELAIRLAVLLYAYAGCDSRQIQKVLEVINLLFCNIVGKVPSHQVILDWVVKCGLCISRESYKGKSLKLVNAQVSKGYHIIMDNSINYNNQEIHLELAATAQHPGHALAHADMQVVNMSVSKSWSADDMKKELDETIKSIGYKPDYITTDNCKTIKKLCSSIEIPHHKDITHSFGMYLEQVYGNDADYIRFKDRMSYSRKFGHTEIAHLIPPAQRSISRFLNEFERVDWAYAIRSNFFLLPPRGKLVFNFVNEMGSFIDEMKEIIGLFRVIEKKCKNDGLSRETAKECRRLINESLMLGAERQRAVGGKLIEYFSREESLLESKDAVHNICSDIIESSFGYIKYRISSNRNNGFTPLILVLPVHLKVADIENCKEFNVKTRMEQTRYADIRQFRADKLLKNPSSDRRRILSKAAGF